MSGTMFQFPKSPASELLILIGLCLIGIAVSSGVGLMLAAQLTGNSMESLQEIMAGGMGDENGKIPLLILQGSISLGGFVLFPFLSSFFIRSQGEKYTFIVPSFTLLVMVVGLAFLMMPVNGWLVSWNQSIRLPSFLHDFELWAIQKEKEMEKLTLYLMDIRSKAEFLVGFLVIALIAGFSEEYFFRKRLQPLLHKITGNVHTGVWLTAFFFSAIHFQFYGLIPRMVLGALFGYYFAWTGNFWIPVLGHALNNGLTFIGMYLYKANISPLNMEDPNVVPWYIGGVACGVAWSVSVMVMEESQKIKERLQQPGSVNDVFRPRF